jgi:hypothetical protein
VDPPIPEDAPVTIADLPARLMRSPIVCSARRGSRDIEHIGPAQDDARPRPVGRAQRAAAGSASLTWPRSGPS